MTAGELKQMLLRIYNAINKQIFNTGVRQQSVDLIGNKIIIVSINTRVAALKVLQEEHAEVTQRMDFLLAQQFKQRIRAELERQLGLKILTVFKDYDTATEFSGTVVVLENEVAEYYE